MIEKTFRLAVRLKIELKMESTTTPTTKTSDEEGETSRYFGRRTEISGVWPFSSSNQGSKSNSTKSNKTPEISSSTTSVHSSASGSSSVYQRTPFRFQKITSDSATTLASNFTSSNSYCTETRTATDSRTEFLSELSRLILTIVTLSWKSLFCTVLFSAFQREGPFWTLQRAHLTLATPEHLDITEVKIRVAPVSMET